MPRGNYPEDTTFGKRIRELTSEKRKVAKAVINRFLGQGSSAFIGDGSSTFFVGTYMIEKKMQATIWTNHVAIANEYALQKSNDIELIHTDMFIASGQIDRDLMMTYEQNVENNISRWASKAQCIILSVRNLFGDKGPAGMERKSLSIKQEAVKAGLESGVRIIFVADHLKISKGYTTEPLVFPAERDWKDAMDSTNVFIVSTAHPTVTDEQLVRRPRNEDQWFQRNHWTFSRTMRDRYIEV